MKNRISFTCFAVSLALSFLLFSGCGKSQDDSAKDDTPPATTSIEAKLLTASPLPGHSGKIQDAMSFKKATVIGFNSGEERFKDDLRGIPEEVPEDTILTFVENSIPTTAKPYIYLLYGWSGWGGDDMRQIRIDSVQLAGHTVNLFVTKPTIEHDQMMVGTDDMRFIGWTIEIDRFEPGDYTLRLFEKKEKVKVTAQSYTRTVVDEGKYELRKEAGFTSVINEL
ncbi:hypothetical protein KJ564_15925 [bacterium]|nr:hypothetical protein [bacterium]